MTARTQSGHKWRTKYPPVLSFPIPPAPQILPLCFPKILGIEEWQKACRQIPKTFHLRGPVLNFSFLFYKMRTQISGRDKNVKYSVPSKQETLNKWFSILLVKSHCHSTFLYFLIFPFSFFLYFLFFLFCSF